MIFRRRKGVGSRGRTDFRLEEEHSRIRATGFGIDGYVRIRDETGNVWSGLVESSSENVLRYYLTDSHGRRITGLANSHSMIFRDDLGRTWKGVME
jgi:hypothetical protein